MIFSQADKKENNVKLMNLLSEMKRLIKILFLLDDDEGKIQETRQYISFQIDE